MAQDRSVCRFLKEVYVQQWTSFGGYDDDEDSTRYALTKISVRAKISVGAKLSDIPILPNLELEAYQIFIYTLLCQIPIFAGYCRYLIVNRY